MTEPHSLSILVVEDDPDACSNLRDILELDGHRVSAAGSAEEALRLLDETQPEVVLLDRKLPDSSAEDLLPRLKSRLPTADIIIVTGHGDFESSVLALRLGAMDYLLKPVNVDALRASVGRIAENRRLRREVERRESAFHNLVEAAPSMIVILRSDGRIAYFSPFAEGLTGYATGDVVGKDGFEIFLPETERSGWDAELERIVDGTPTRGYESSILLKDGSQRWMLWNAQRIEDFDGEPAILAAGLDVTDQKRVLERLVQSERLAALGEAMASLAHESRNALQRGQASLELLERQIRDRPAAIGLLQRIQDAQDDLHQLYEEVREYAAPLRLRIEPCRPSSVLQEAWEHLAVQRRGRIVTLSLDDQTAGSQCEADSLALRRVFRNILENSLAACKDPVEIAVSLRRAPFNGSSALVVNLRDNGPGLTVEQRQRIFEAFFTTKTHGTGLGMAICKRLIDAHGGGVSVGPGPGAEIIVTVPWKSTQTNRY
ncbi:MAG: response regulator [Planctomycetaceae bacterium]